MNTYKYGMKKIPILLSLLVSLAWGGRAEAAVQDGSGARIEKVFVIFKTHLDIGFTDLSSKVEQRYVDLYIPKAIEVARRLREEGRGEGYVWTTGAWLVDAYLRQASPEAAAELEEAVRRGDIVWNGMPYTVESESMNRALFEGILRLSRRLDARFGKHTVAAKMTDVPGHTRSIVPLLSEAGIRFLHVGTNPAVSVPDVPPVCRWRDRSGHEIILMYQGSYGDTMILPDGRTAVSVNLTGDNHGPHSVEEVHGIFASLRERYPGARIVAASLNDVAEAIEPMRGSLPVVTSEIGDTWIYGYGSSPLRMARFRELGRLYDEWIGQGRLDPDSDEAVDFAVRLGMIAEHTWGVDVKTHLRNWDKYDFDSFTAARGTQPEFRFAEQSWHELDENIDKAVALLPDTLRAEAAEALRRIGEVDRRPVAGDDTDRRLDAEGRYELGTKTAKCLLGGIAYQSFSSEDYARFQDAYLTSRVQWAVEDNGKPGLESSPARSAVIEARVAACEVERGRRGRHIRAEMVFPEDERIDGRVLPEAVRCEWVIARDGRSAAWTVDIVGKPANRMPEAYWVSFRPEEIISVVAEKTGDRVDLLDVVPGGNRQMHGIDRYVDVVTRGGTLRITSPDALLAVVGERGALNYSTERPDLRQGIHFCLYNNLWGTNFSMWWGGDMRYRFYVEWLDDAEKR